MSEHESGSAEQKQNSTLRCKIFGCKVEYKPISNDDGLEKVKYRCKRQSCDCSGTMYDGVAKDQLTDTEKS